ncbi:MAG: radical SAM protein, partial [Candidatus Omnitrophota bacterium]
MFEKVKVRERIFKSKGAMPLPKALIFEPTITCNLHCSMCERYVKPSELNRREMELIDIIRFIKKLPKTIKSVYISGGEPFMRRDIIDICQEFLKQNISVRIQTNGTFVDKVLELAKINGVDLMFSLDGTREVHNKIRGEPFVFDRNLNIFKTLRNEFNRELIITSVITETNLNILKDLIKLLYEENLKSFLIIELERIYTKQIIDETSKMLGITINDLPAHLKNKTIPSYSFQEFTRTINELKKELKLCGFNYCFFPGNLIPKAAEFYYRTYREHNELYCSYLDDLRIDSCGNIIPCFAIRKAFGNVTKDSIKTIWNSKEYCEFRIKLLEHNLAPICETCFKASEN